MAKSTRRSRGLIMPILVCVLLAGGIMYGLNQVNSPQGGPTASSTTTMPPAAGPGVPSGTDVPDTAAPEQAAPDTTGKAPLHVVAVQGPVLARARYVSVTWDRNDPTATGYEVYRDGTLIATRTISGDGLQQATTYLDKQASAGANHAYAVRAQYRGGRRSAESPAYNVRVKDDSDFGNAYNVESYSGTDIEKAQAAVNAADAAGGGIVQFGARAYTFASALIMSNADKVVLRGAGRDSTFITTSQPGGTDPNDPCGATANLIYVDGPRATITPTLTQAIGKGDSTAQFNSTTGLSVGQVLFFDEGHKPDTPQNLDRQNVVQDPGTPNDDRFRTDGNEIVAIDGDTVAFRYPFIFPFTTSVRPTIITSGNNNRIELMTLQGPGDTSHYYSLVYLNANHFTVSDVTLRWSNRNVLQNQGGYDLNVVGIAENNVNPQGVGGICKYRFSLNKMYRAYFVNSIFGNADGVSDHSYISVNRSARLLIRNNVFRKSDTYAFDSHGQGSMDTVFENNDVATGFTGLRLGNPDWGFSGPILVRNNRFEGNDVDVELVENSYQLVFLDNVSSNNRHFVIYAAGWQGPDTPPNNYGSFKMTIRRNTVTNAQGDAFFLGGIGGYFGYIGVKDVIIAQNNINSAGRAIVINGTSTDSRRFQVTNNTGTNRYVHPPFVPGDNWSGNVDGATYGSPVNAPWSSESFTWEGPDNGVRP